MTVNRSVDAADRESEPEFIPYNTDRPVGLDLDEFLPVSKYSIKFVFIVTSKLDLTYQHNSFSVCVFISGVA